jgi:two-component system chemotaxis sensor kinase CheA
MSDIDNTNEYLLEVFIIETSQLLEQLEGLLLGSEKEGKLQSYAIEETFRIMHTIKGSAAMMSLDNISRVSHVVEDLFDFARNNPNRDYSDIYNVVLSSIDFIKYEVSKLENKAPADGNPSGLIEEISKLLNAYTQSNDDASSDNQSGKNESYLKVETTAQISDEGVTRYHAKVFFEEGCGMENLRAFAIVYSLKDVCDELYHRPADIADNSDSAEYIIKNGFEMYFRTDKSEEEVAKLLENSLFVESFTLNIVESYEDEVSNKPNPDGTEGKEESKKQDHQELEMSGLACSLQPSYINVDIKKLDRLLDLVGEIIIAESAVTKHPALKDLKNLDLDKSVERLARLISELQDSVMSIRTVPLSSTLSKMQRIVRDMAKKLSKEAELVIQGGDTEVDKNIVANISETLIHIVRNSMDHGIEPPAVRAEKGKSEKGTITISAGYDGGEVFITVTDDGAGLDKQKIIDKAQKSGIYQSLGKSPTDRDIYGLIMHPGFSTKKEISEYSGRGVGMDVVKTNVEKVGGRIFIESTKDKGMTVFIKIPLTLAIIDGINISVAETVFTIPSGSIREFFKIRDINIISDNDGNEMTVIRDKCYPILRLSSYFDLKSNLSDADEQIVVLAEMDDRHICLVGDAFLGEQQVVVKSLPYYLVQYGINELGISGCSILGNGAISLILDVKEIMDKFL